MRAFHASRVQWDRLRGRVEEQLDRIVARLAVDVYGPSVRWCSLGVQPPVVRKPGLGLGHHDQLAAVRVINFQLPLLEVPKNLFDAPLAPYRGPDSRFRIWLEVDVCDLVIDHREGPR